MLLQQLAVVLLSTDDTYTLLSQVKQRYGNTIKIGVCCVLSEKTPVDMLVKKKPEKIPAHQLTNIWFRWKDNFT